MTKQINSSLKLAAALLLCVGSQVVKAQSPHLDIKQAIDTALANNYALRADSLNIRIADYKNKQLAGSYLPQVNLNSRFNYNPAIASQMIPGSFVNQPSKDYVPVQFGTRYDAGSGIEVNQNIYRKDLLVQMRAAGLYKGIAQTRHQLTKEELVYQVASSFYNLQSQAEIIRSTTKDYDNLKDVLRIAKSQFQNGTLKRIDMESLQINVANKESELTQLQTRYDEQLEYFKYLLGIPADQPLSISDSISLQAAVSPNVQALSTKREDIHLYSQLIESKQVDIKAIRAENLPSLSTYFKYNYQSQFSKADKMFDNDYWYNSSSMGLTVSVPLFDGNRKKNRVRVAQAELQQLKWQKNQNEDRAITELKTAWEKLGSNRRQFEVNTENLVLAEKVFNSRKALYTEGVTTLVELLDAERELTQARNLHLQSLISVQTGQLDVHKANGTLLTEFLTSL